jgi:hypothetical protein
VPINIQSDGAFGVRVATAPPDLTEREQAYAVVKSDPYLLAVRGGELCLSGIEGVGDTTRAPLRVTLADGRYTVRATLVAARCHRAATMSAMAERTTARLGYVRDVDLNFEALVILDEPSGDTLEIQRSLSFDEQDTAAGMDTYCLVVSAGATHYGGVESWAVRDGMLTLSLSEAAAAVLELPADVDISVRAADEAPLRDHLARLVGPL